MGSELTIASLQERSWTHLVPQVLELVDQHLRLGPVAVREPEEVEQKLDVVLTGGEREGVGSSTTSALFLHFSHAATPW